MTIRFVTCEFCQTLGDFQAFSMCPLCRKVICPRCRGEQLLQPGKCAKKTLCVEAAPAKKE